MARAELGGDDFFVEVEYDVLTRYYGKEEADRLVKAEDVDTGVSEEELEETVKDGWSIK